MTAPPLQQSRMRHSIKVIIPLSIVGAAVVIAGIMIATRPLAPKKPPEERAWVVATKPATPGDEQPVMSMYGEIVAGRETELRPLVPGRIIGVGPNFRDGGKVAAGDLLIAIDPFDYKSTVEEISAQLTGERQLLENDRAQIALSRAEVKRREKLAGSGAGSLKNLDDAKLALADRESRMIARQESMERLGVLLRRAERDEESARLTAPFGGVLLDTAAAEGKQVSTGDRIARLVDTGRLEVRFHVSDSQFARLLAADDYIGRALKVRWKAGEHTFAFDGAIDRIDGRIDAATGGALVYGILEGVGPDTVLRPGAFVHVEVPDRVYRQVLRLPESALHNGDTIYVAEESEGASRLATRQVALVVRDGNDVLIRGNFGQGDKVVITRFPEIGPGVRIVEAVGATPAER
ncbi:MAG: efflux RND transporter periplasmic adaptor subunit [Rhodospirillales bacterium]|nr:efflux RND transporter periplasmic adaptor subunit [Rhodospirillales bacterium]MCW8863068.1 efflux RND transporter periplasmic adaptor subunit [Rhodospirillales bacterium]MCW9001351.1 efflux RND transporter periplasmic adaptor subunit [Rhodospirillales bacterium]